MKIHRVLFIVVFFAIENIASIFKFTNLHCKSLNETLIEVKQCRLRAIKRDITKLNANILMKSPIKKAIIEGEIMKRANGYKPFLMKLKYDGCEYMRRRNHPVINMIVNSIKNFSNMNHTCPYKDELIIKDFYLMPNYLNNLPLPTGDYAIMVKWTLNGIKTLLTDIYFQRVEDVTD